MWSEFKHHPPGRRFQDRYERHKEARATRPWWHFLPIWGGGLVLLAIGMFLSVFPGPGIPFLLLGGGLLASESRPLARLLDWIEVKVRQVIAWAMRCWCWLPIAARVIVVLVAAALGAGAAYVGYRVFFGGA